MNKSLKPIVPIIMLLVMVLFVTSNSVLAVSYNGAFVKGKPFVCMFYTTWCGTCKRMRPKYDALSAKYSKKLNFVSVDIDKQPELQQKYGIQRIPQFYLINPKNLKTYKFPPTAVLDEDTFIDYLYQGLKSLK